MIPIPWLGHAIEVVAALLFAWAWFQARRRGDGLHIELMIAVVYGCVLELLDMRIFGSYHYGAMTWWWVGDVPLYIPLLWAAIIHSSMALSDCSGVPERVRPFLDGLLAVLIDLAVDAIAIRVGLWHWRIPLSEGWFGVPAGNLCAWMWVAAWYGWTTRLLRRRLVRGEPRWHRALIPIVAYAGLISSLMLIGVAGEWTGLRTPNQRLWLFAAHVIGFGVVVIVGSRSRRAGAAIPLSSFRAARWLMHGSFALILVATGLWRLAPALIAVSSVSLIVEWVAQRWCEPSAKALTS